MVSNMEKVRDDDMPMKRTRGTEIRRARRIREGMPGKMTQAVYKCSRMYPQLQAAASSLLC